ncbi:MAG: hypothetical protein L6Q92_10410 [Phycisphaerae bacterium]|nr:hypothetical protein [Phycisphaerae bacterium]
MSVPTPMPTASNELIAALRRMRRRIRLCLAIAGLAQILAVAIIAFLIAAVLDWYVEFPSLLRSAALATGAAFGAVAITRRIVRPLLRPIDLREIAARLDARLPRFDGRLASVVDHAERHADGAEPLWQRVEREAADALRDIPLHPGLERRTTYRLVATAAAAVIAVWIVRSAMPDWSATAWSRLLWPSGATTWPHRVQIVPLTGSIRTARGEPVTVEMRLARGGSPSLRAFLVAREPGRRTTTHMMRLDDDGIYRWTFPSVTKDVAVWFRAGDDDTASTPIRIRVLDRPQIVRAAATITPPAYLGDAASRPRALDQRPLAVLEGSRVALDWHCSKPVAIEAGEPLARVRLEDGGERPVRLVDTAGTRLRCELTASQTMSIELSFTDQEGLALRPPAVHHLDLHVDQPPRIAIVEPSRALDVTPDAEVTIRIEAGDDFGLASVELVVDSAGGERRTVLPLPLQWRAVGDQQRAEATTVLRVRDFRAEPGDTIEFRAVARDNFALDGRRHDPVDSGPMRLHIVSAAQMQERLAAELAALRQRLLGLLDDQESVRDETNGVSAALTTGSATQPADVEPLRRVALGQRQLLLRSRQLVLDTSGLVERARANRVADDDVHAQAQHVADGLGATTEGPMNDSAAALDRAAERPNAPARTDALADAAAQQLETVEQLRRLVAVVDQWNDLHDAARKGQDLLDRQEVLTRRAAALARQLAGLDVEQLSDPQRQRLRSVATDQQRLSQDADAVLTRLRDLAAALESRDAASAESIRRAIRSAEALGLIEKLADAARHVDANRLNRAQDAQLASEAALRAMLDALRRPSERRLEALSKQLRDIFARLDRIIAAQQRLRTDTRSAQDQTEQRDLARRLAERQLSLRTTTRQSIRAAPADLPGVEAARNQLRAAAEHMAAAATNLSAVRMAPADAAQEAALAALQSARRTLEQLEARAEREQAEQAMARIREALTKIRAAQSRLLDSVAELEKRRGDSQRLSRTDRAKLPTMRKSQTALADGIAALDERLQSAVVYQYVCQKIEQHMRSAADLLEAQDLTAAAARQRRAVRELDRLIGALAIEQPPKEQFQAAGGPPGGPGQPTPDRPVPPLAELLVLRAMQAELNDDAANAAPSTEELQIADDPSTITQLGDRQRDIRELAERLISNARRDAGEAPDATR